MSHDPIMALPLTAGALLDNLLPGPTLHAPR
jgi:hypothetical protein